MNVLKLKLLLHLDVLGRRTAPLWIFMLGLVLSPVTLSLYESFIMSMQDTMILSVFVDQHWQAIVKGRVVALLLPVLTFTYLAIEKHSKNYEDIIGTVDYYL